MLCLCIYNGHIICFCKFFTFPELVSETGEGWFYAHIRGITKFAKNNKTLISVKAMETISAMLVHLSCRDGVIKMRMQIGCTEEISEDILSEISLNCGEFSCSVQDEDIIIDVNVPDGGDAV